MDPQHGVKPKAKDGTKAPGFPVETDESITADRREAVQVYADNSPPLKRTENRAEGMLPHVSIASPVIVRQNPNISPQLYRTVCPVKPELTISDC
jgi:hypothetical protein